MLKKPHLISGEVWLSKLQLLKSSMLVNRCGAGETDIYVVDAQDLTCC